jgi:hypothetical protein
MVHGTDVVSRVADAYRRLGVIKGSVILLSRTQVLAFIHDLVLAGATIYGVDGWRIIDADKGWIVQELEADFAVPEEILRLPDNSQISGTLAIQYIRADVPANVDYLSITY